MFNRLQNRRASLLNKMATRRRVASVKPNPESEPPFSIEQFAHLVAENIPLSSIESIDIDYPSTIEITGMTKKGISWELEIQNQGLKFGWQMYADPSPRQFQNPNGHVLTGAYNLDGAFGHHSLVNEIVEDVIGALKKIGAF